VYLYACRITKVGFADEEDALFGSQTRGSMLDEENDSGSGGYTSLPCLAIRGTL
jgi:hypothetical protein